MAYTLNRREMEIALETLNQPTDEYLRIQMVCLLRNCLQEAVTDFAFIVDDFPNFNIIISRPKDLTSSSSEAWPVYWCFIFYILREDKNDALFRKMMLNNDVIDWTRNTEKSLFTYGLSETQKSIFDEVAQTYGWVTWGEGLEGKTFSIQEDDINNALIEVPSIKQLTCSTLRLDEAVLVQRRWQHIHADDPNVTTQIEFCIKNFPNICLRNDKDEVIAHMLTACNGEMLMLNVTESHRRQGLGTAVQLLLCRKIYEQNERPIWIVLANNEQSLQMNAKMGAKLLDNGKIVYGNRYKYID